MAGHILQLREQERQEAFIQGGRDYMHRMGIDASLGRPSNDGFAPIMPMLASGVVGLPSARAYYDLGNQNQYTVTMGPALLRFRGAVVRRVEGLQVERVENESGTVEVRCPRNFNYLFAYSGWVTDILTRQDGLAEHSGSVEYLTAYTKGVLKRAAVRTWIPQLPDNCHRMRARYVYRYQYHAPDGQVVAFFERPQETPRAADFRGGCHDLVSLNEPEPTLYWSSDGNASLDTTNRCKPVIRWPDGSVEEFHPPVTEPGVDRANLILFAEAYKPTCSGAAATADLRKIDRHGNITTFRYETADDGRKVQRVIDTAGRQTTLAWDVNDKGMPRLLSVEMPSIGGADPYRYEIRWKRLTFRFDEVWPDVPCTPEGSDERGCKVPVSLDVVETISTPDGRNYAFGYGDWGNLVRVVEPSGAIRDFVHGGADNLQYGELAAAALNHPQMFTCNGIAHSLYSEGVSKMQARGVIAEDVYPNPSEPPLRRTLKFVSRGAVAAGCAKVWLEATEPDGSMTATGSLACGLPPMRDPPEDDKLAIPPLVPALQHGMSLGSEKWSGGKLISAIYNGDPDTGEPWFASEFVKVRGARFAVRAGLRPTKTRTVRDGLTFTTNFEYGNTIDVAPGTAVENRNTAEATASCVFAGIVNEMGCNVAGKVPLKLTRTTHTHYYTGNPQDRNILNMPTSVRLFGPNAEGTALATSPLTEARYEYDQFAVTRSERDPTFLDAGLSRDALARRGNLTSTIERVDAGREIATRRKYFDTGDLESVIDGRGFTTVHERDFRLCDETPTLVSWVTNAVGHRTRAVADCISQLTLSTTDANGISAYTQYDYLGRPVETAAAGDFLTHLATSGRQAFTRDPDAPTQPGTQPGDANVTSWVEYQSQGIVGEQRSVIRVRDGSPGGRYTKEFFDGLNRPIQTRIEVDPDTTTLPEVVTTTVYDKMGKVARSLLPCFAAAADRVTEHCGNASIDTQYDALGRPTKVTKPGSRTTAHDYTSEGELWLTRTTDARGFLTRTYSNRLDQVVQIDEQSSLCAGGFCTTSISHDVAGRVLTQSDESGLPIVATYDGLGRRRTMSDPDMGGNEGKLWTFTYDNNGNLESQLDPKGQLIKFEYDAINRITRKNLPPADEEVGPEDVTYFYDGAGPAPPSVDVPAVAALSPSGANAGSAPLTVTIDGSNFTAASIVRVRGQDRQTNFVSAERLTASIPGADLSAPGGFEITVFTPGFGGGLSNARTFTVGALTPPSIASISPASGIAGSGAFTLTVDGSDFVDGAAVRFNGQSRQTTFVSTSRLTAAILASDVQNAGESIVTVRNPAGEISNTAIFTVRAVIVPTITAIHPATAFVGSGALTLAVDGSNFVSGAVVSFNGQARPTTFVSAMRLTAEIPATDLQAVGTFPVVVTNPAPEGGVSTAVNFAVKPPPPTIASVSPTIVEAGGGNVMLTVNGTNFVGSSKLAVNHVVRTATVLSSTQLRAEIFAHEIQQPGTRAISVYNDDTPSNSVNIVINARPRVTLTSPTGGQIFTLPATIPLRANVIDDTPGAVVDYYSYFTLLGSSSAPPDYAVTWSNPSVGQHAVKAKVRDAHGSVAESTTATIQVQRPQIQPKITTLSPSSVQAGVPGFLMTITGQDFESGASVTIDGQNRKTTFVSSTQLTVGVLAFDVQSEGSRTVRVTNLSGFASDAMLRVVAARRYNVALAAHGGVATASSTHPSHSAANVINGDRRGPNVGGVWADHTPDVYPDWIQIDFNGEKAIDEVALFSMQNNAYTSTVEPTETMTGSQYVVTNFTVQIWTSRGWSSPNPLASPDPAVVTGNSLIWRRVTFSPVTTTRVRITVNGSGDNYTQIPEVEVYGADGRFNVALSRNGGVASASSTHATHSAGALIDGDTRGANLGGIWADATPSAYPDWIQVDFPSEKVIDQVDLYSLQNNAYTSTIEPDEKLTGSHYVATSFEVQYWTNNGWVTPPGGNVTGNNLIWRRVAFPEVPTARVRVIIRATADNYSQIPELQVWGRDRHNAAAATAGGVITASSTASVHSTANLNDGNRRGPAIWADGTPNVYPDWIQIDFGAARTIDGIGLFSMQDAYPNVVDPSPDLTGTRFVAQEFEVQYWTGAWTTVPGSSVGANNKIARVVNFAPVTTDKLRIVIKRTPDNYTQIAEVEAYVQGTP